MRLPAPVRRALFGMGGNSMLWKIKRSMGEEGCFFFAVVFAIMAISSFIFLVFGLIWDILFGIIVVLTLIISITGFLIMIGAMRAE